MNSRVTPMMKCCMSTPTYQLHLKQISSMGMKFWINKRFHKKFDLQFSSIFSTTGKNCDRSLVILDCTMANSVI